MKRPSQRGVALVITLLMLSVVTVVTVTFLAVSRRERAAVSQTINLTDSLLMADTGLERAKAQIIAPIMATTNMLAGDLSVSRNYINLLGFQPGVANPTNINYDYRQGGGLVTPADFLQNVANLQLDARAPVFVRTNRPGTPLASEFRFYLDLNRNGQFETNGFFLPYDDAGAPIGTNVVFFVGDPEWIGVLEKPNLPHSANNRFIGRYAYIILPVGKSLDINFIHNQSQPLAANRGRFFRNQGFGTYEINLAAFLTALNNNVSYGWGDYFYGGTNVLGGSTGAAFINALDFVRYRYVGDYNNNDTVATIFGPNAPQFSSDGIDGLAHIETLTLDDIPTGWWPGASSRQHFYSINDFFDRNKLPSYTLPDLGFVDRLTIISGRTNSHDRYTFSSLLSQLGTDSAEEPVHANIPKLIQQISAGKSEEFLADTVGRINLNYDNINYVASDFTNWVPLAFFTNVGNILLREQVPFGITNSINNIQIVPVNRYSLSVHRLLQVAANIYDATSTDSFPSVFLPQVGILRSNGVITTNITGYTTNLNRATALRWASTNQYGLPAIVGAKKGLPNFNEYVFQTVVQITRKLEVGRPATNSLPNQTNQIMLLSISNLFAVETWNSYSRPFNTDFRISVSNQFSAVLSNAVDGFTLPVNTMVGSDGLVAAATNGNWYFKNNRKYGYDGYTNGFLVPLYTNLIVLTNSRYYGTGFDDLTNSYLPRTGNLPVADWRLIVSNKLTYVVSTVSRSGADKVFDIASFSYQTNLNLTELMMRQNNDFKELAVMATLWDTNRVSNPATPSTATRGILTQLGISLGQEDISDADWKALNFESNDKQSSIASFKAFVNNTAATSNLFQQAPFTASRRFVHTVTWQANDPLVHYMLEDLKDSTNNAVVRFLKPKDVLTNSLSLGRLNERYRPWLGNPNKSSDADPNESYVGAKDPGVFSSQDWDFPAQKFPSIGWLGRVHRGTPWQTVYLKAEVADPVRWRRQSLDPLTHPINDWRLLDIFTVAQTPNASHGQLSINQSGLAAWAAVLGGITVLSNTTPTYNNVAPTAFTNLLIDATNTPLLQFFVDGINRNRQQRPNQVFHSLGELLSVPELTFGQVQLRGQPAQTVYSPFLDLSSDIAKGWSLNDEAYERIPRQILSLLKVGDARYVVYAFGQSLKPADKSIVTSGNFFGMCTNYQITGEVFTRTVVKIAGGARNPQPAILNFNILPAD